MQLPAAPWSAEDIFQTLTTYRAQDLDWRDGRAWAYIYDAGPEVEAVAKRAYMEFLSENALDPTAFPSVLRLENELVALGARHLRGDAEVAGNFTSGGTESIVLACKTARDRTRALRPEVRRGRLALPVTAHAAFHKAAHYLDLAVDLFDVDPRTFQASPEAAARVLTEDTIMLVGSAPSYAHGVVDDIPGLAALARARGVLMHVDACVGGWMLPFLRRLGQAVPDFDFAVPGVTSISMDLHKYAYCPKGASLILYRDRDLRQHQLFACSNWTGYTIVNPTVLSTRSGGPMAAAWATLHFLGDPGYLRIAQAVREATVRVVEGIRAIPGLQVLGEPQMALVAAASDTDEVHIFHVIDEMKRLGWTLQPQLGWGPHKENFHLSLNASTAPRVDALLADLAVAVERARGLPSPVAGLGEGLGALDPATLPPELFGQILAALGVQGTALPERLAGIHAVLNSLPPHLADAFLTRFFNELYHHKAS